MGSTWLCAHITLPPDRNQLGISPIQRPMPPPSRQLLNKTLDVWGLATERLLRSLKGQTGPVNSVAVTTVGAKAVSGSADRQICSLRCGSRFSAAFNRSHAIPWGLLSIYYRISVVPVTPHTPI
jgi:hypothetical protein